MPEPIGSVYLDQPRPSRPRSDPKRRGRATIAAQLGFIGIVGLTIAGLLAGVRHLVSSPDELVDAIDTALEDPESRAEIEDELAIAIRESLLGPGLLEAAAAWGVDPETEIDAWTAAVVADPAFSDAIADLIVDIHGRVLIEADAEPVDVGALTEIVISAATDTAPGLAFFLPSDAEVIHIDGSDLPDLTGPMSALDQAIMMALVTGAALPLAILVHHRRHLVLSWVGRWMLVVGIALAGGAVGLPWLAGRLTGWVTAEAAVKASSLRLLAPAAVAGIIGMAFASMGAVGRRHEKRKTAQEGAAAWLDVIEPPPTAASSPSLDLARRGLADGSRHLTNI